MAADAARDLFFKKFHAKLEELHQPGIVLDEEEYNLICKTLEGWDYLHPADRSERNKVVGVNTIYMLLCSDPRLHCEQVNAHFGLPEDAMLDEALVNMTAFAEGRGAEAGHGGGPSCCRGPAGRCRGELALGYFQQLADKV